MTSSRFSRRHFISAAASAAASLSVSARADERSSGTAPRSGEFQEPAQNLPLVSDADVIVCGAGPAGVSAAIAAGRAGARVRMFEVNGCLGGVWTAGLLGYLLDFDKPGFNQELVRRLRERDAIRGKG